MELESGEIMWGDSTVPDSDPDMQPGRPTDAAAILAGIAIAVALILGAGFVFSRGEPQPDHADSFNARDLFAAAGGVDGLTIGTAVGAFDLVRFDPSNPNRLLASHRSSYGVAQNQSSNEVWSVIDDGSVAQDLLAPDTAHDFAHFNVDGTTTMWIHGGGDGFAPRVALHDGVSTEPLYASRFTAAGETVFALTGDGDYYSQRVGFVDLVADRGSGVVVLDDGSKYAWIDNPSADILVAYPSNENGLTTVWDVDTLTPLPDHVLASRRIRRSALSADGTTAVTLTFAGDLRVIDTSTGWNQRILGRIDGAGVDQPLTLSPSGDVLVTVEAEGSVKMWWTREDGEPFAQFNGASAQPRWLSEQYAPVSASAVAPDASRIALRTAATPDARTTWIIIDTDLNSWREKAERSQSLSGTGTG